MKPISIILITFVLLLAIVLGRQAQQWHPLDQLHQALQLQPAEDRAGRPMQQR